MSQAWPVSTATITDFPGGTADVADGSWLRDNALTQPATVHDPVNVVRHGRFEQFFLLDDQDLP